MTRSAKSAADRAWSTEVRRLWFAFWGSEQAAGLRASDHAAVRRLFGWYHLREKLAASIDLKTLIVEGSTGQPKVTPLLGEMRAIDDQIEGLEKRIFGAPAAGPSGGQSDDPSALLDAANARFAELVRSNDVPTADTRLELVEGGAA